MDMMTEMRKLWERITELHTMSMRLVSSGSYNVRASEMAHLQDRTPKTVTCVVHFLDDSCETFEIDKRAKAQNLLDKVFEHLELVEKDYFGLQYLDLPPGDDALRWLDPLKTIKKQCRVGPPFEFFFRVKFYVSDPSKLAEEYTRYHFFLQVKRDILSEKLVCPPSQAALLASYSVQSELGDYNPDEHKDGYLADFLFIPSQTDDFEKMVSEKHKQHRGQTPADAEYNFLDKAKRLDMYGIDLHNARVRDQSNIEIQLGVTSAGLVVFQNNVKINTFSWAKIVKISFKRKQFFIQLRREAVSVENDSIENLIGFNMISYRSCKNLWKSCVEHHTFFRLHHPNPPSKKIFSIGSKFRYSDGGFLSHNTSRDTYPAPAPTKVVNFNSSEENTRSDQYYDIPAYEEYISNGNGYADGHGLVTIRMTPDDLGRFGFNVKVSGGADQGMPIIVSRVAPGTPADLAIPRLNEGDQVLFINGRDVSQHTHEQVVMFIKASRETHSGELVLVVRPNVYVGEDQSEEPDFTYIPETHQIASSSSSANTLESSLMLLQESLESGAALAQFEQLYRKKPNMTMNAARNESNIPKNRYRDISPYDKTRVVLKTGSSGDYINANYVNMEIPGSGIVNRYIAAQGPLPNTCTDFWQMVWEQHSSLVVMLTTKVERGRVKCHQYWPELYETEDFGALQITCVKEEETPSFAFREFNLTHVETSEERHIRHMQYIAWPDHGVPDDPSDFLEFVMKVRQNRSGMVEPTIVHCSAGIGRTGVLITMETAMCRVEARQPVYPLIVVKEMRDQRAMLIQTSSQYKFVCEAILRVYNEGLVKPSEDYHR
ncbi:tyrosine-protein phosphatase non-receptor type 4-like isoform X14 [Haliotis rufescens]|uniref:tyrosine-protein phosphatase non-receptor type 4-like isoform X14 n=1 Tax=Haliotis rufescens TaxID=6454 RepID=UPI001EB080C1|nr:tyrosine-protein phosphatase non-receptor type 4-like isoform X14 [Haliotis rufescens]